MWFDGRYEGDWRTGHRHGFGRERLASGELYDGEWLHDMRDGIGKLYRTDGVVIEGMWRGNALCNFTILEDAAVQQYTQRLAATMGSGMMVGSVDPHAFSPEEVTHRLERLLRTNSSRDGTCVLGFTWVQSLEMCCCDGWWRFSSCIGSWVMVG